MADSYSLTKASIEKLRRALNKLDRQVVNLRRLPRSNTRGGQRRKGIPIYNASGSTIPPYSIVRVLTGGPTTARKLVYVSQANTYGAQLHSHLITGSAQIRASEQGLAQAYPPYIVNYDTGNTPAFGESWGPVSSSFKVVKKSAGFYILGIWDSTNALAQVMPNPFYAGKGTLDGALSTGSSATCSVYDDSGDTTYNITVYDSSPALIPTAQSIASGAKVSFVWMPTHRQFHVISSNTCPA